MIPAYENNYELYFQDQITKFESFEGELYVPGIVKTIDYIFPQQQEGRLLDFCCGDGTTSKFLVAKGFDLTGFDGNENKINRAALETDGIFFVCSAESAASFINDKFNVIYASHCFEHFLEPMVVLETCKSLLNEGGKIVMILPYPNESFEGHPGSNELKLNAGILDVGTNFEDSGWIVNRLENVNFREPELIIELIPK